MYGGFRVRLDDLLVDTREDWSGVRSPSRARRRRRQGHPQRIKIVGVPKSEAYRIGDMLVMHPATWRQLQSLMDRENAEKAPLR